MVLLKDIILVIVGFKGEVYGYEILKEFEKFVIGFWKFSYSNFYMILNKMVEEGFLELREEYRGRVRCVKYRFIDKGWEYFKIFNNFIFRIFYMVVEYYEVLKKKFEEIGKIR